MKVKLNTHKININNKEIFGSYLHGTWYLKRLIPRKKIFRKVLISLCRGFGMCNLKHFKNYIIASDSLFQLVENDLQRRSSCIKQIYLHIIRRKTKSEKW